MRVRVATLTVVVLALFSVSVAVAQQKKLPHYNQWLCIHKYEGSWTANTGNGYYGGLQMDISFMRAYGPEFLRWFGTADQWPAWAQMFAAERAYMTRGYHPWPNTARMCGLL